MIVNTITLFVTILLPLSLFAQASIVPFGSDWKYQDNGTDLGVAWRAASFDDSSWETGNGKFGYGESGLATLVDYGPDSDEKYITTYFRKDVSIADMSDYASVEGSMYCDDGLVVYVNGEEVHRYNLPDGTVSYNTLASGADDDGDDVHSFPISPAVFENGTNVIAVEVHQSKPSSSDIVFDMQLAGVEETTAAVADEQQVTGFILIDSHTEQEVKPISNGDVISLASLPSSKVNIRAVTSPASVGSVIFELSGTQSKTYTDRAAPYALHGDNGDGNYYYGNWNPPATGSYTLKATPYSGSDGTGTPGTPLTISFTFVEDDGTPPPAEQYSLSVSTSGSGTVTKNPNQTTYDSGSTVSLTASPASGYAFAGWSGDASGTTNPLSVTMNSNKSITATFTAVSSGEYSLSVSTTGSGTVTKSPDQATYTSGSTVTLEATPASGYTFSGWSGDASGTTNPLAVTMNSNKNITANFVAVSSSQQVTGFMLVDSKTEQEVKPISNGEVISLASLDNTKLNIRAVTSPSSVGSVIFELSGTQSKTYTDQAAPYALHGDNGSGNYYYGNWNPPATGSYTLKATPYSGSGTPGTPLTISFTFVEEGGTPTTDQTPPYVVSISRLSPTTSTTSATSVVFRVAFSEGVVGVGTADFTATRVSGTVSGSVSGVTSGSSTYDVTVSSITGEGELRLDLKASGTGIADAAGNAISGGYTSGQSYLIQASSGGGGGSSGPGFASVTPLTPLSVSKNTADKPQSKVWIHDGKHWTIMPNSSGTHIWRLDGTTWTRILTLISSSSARADCKVVGNVVHALLFRGSSTSYLVSAEYDPATKTYKAWTQRTTRADVPIEDDAETATIDIDGNGRMWVAYDASNDVYVRWSDSPYTSWSSPIRLASGILGNEDDMCAVIALPGKIGVLWSNQNTERFGFRTHTDGASPTSWSGDEAPGASGALNIGYGLADGHLNMAVASDGTLYCAVKTGYDRSGYPKLALLVRRPNGSWDNLYAVTNTTEGTRPIVILNETIGRVRVIYTEIENGGDIRYRESSTSNISFGSSFTLIKGDYNYVTSIKANHSSEVVILASSSSQAVGVLAKDNVSTVSSTSSTVAATAAFVAEEENDLRGELQVYPNPVSSGGTITFSLPADSEYTLKLYDSKGAQVTCISQGSAAAGKLYTVELNGARLNSGLYIVRLQTAEGVKALKLMVEK
ncbi:InlB B-repeat-containing protein [Botryobacter ruber]|uniref:InlB B-repeat-containing protein n=1 Tax=Botryobacter ruber TaxID=2171629 RepID=UPI000E0BABEA|nr:T9SS type A sorting domain-containing protein [Botryobacter ruber]